jgi:hypothetical protein
MGYRSAVICARHWLALSSGGVLLVAAAQAEVDASGESTKHPFLARNPFGLNRPATNAVVVPPSPPPVKVDLKLAGITWDASGKRAWLVVPPSPARGSVPAVTNQTHFAIAEGGRQGEVEVLAIDPKANTVRILNAGVEVTLDFVNNGLSAPPAMAAGRAVAPGAPRGIPMPGAPRGASPSQAAPGFKSAAAPISSAVTSEKMVASRELPTRSVRTAPEMPVVVDPAAQAILIQAQQQAAIAAGRPYPPLPPIPHLQALDQRRVDYPLLPPVPGE